MEFSVELYVSGAGRCPVREFLEELKGADPNGAKIRSKRRSDPPPASRTSPRRGIVERQRVAPNPLLGGVPAGRGGLGSKKALILAPFGTDPSRRGQVLQAGPHDRTPLRKTLVSLLLCSLRWLLCNSSSLSHLCVLCDLLLGLFLCLLPFSVFRG